MKAKRLLIDISEFGDWGGHLTGVQRVVFNIGVELAKIVQGSAEVIYFTYNDATNELVESDINQFAVTTSASPSVPNAASRSKSVAATLYKRAPYAVRSRLSANQKAKLKKLAKTSLNTAKRVRGRISRLRSHSTSATLTNRSGVISPREGDTILSAGRIWDHPRQQLEYSRLRSESGVKLVYVIYDLIPIFQQHTFGPGLTEKYTEYLYNLLSNADLLLPISRSSEADLIRFADEMGFAGVPATKVIRLGDDIPNTSNAQTPHKPQSLTSAIQPKKFALCVGTIEARKNHNLIYMAYKLAAQQGIELPHLVIVGRPGWLTSDTLYFLENDLDIKSSITILKDCDDQSLDWLYRNALMSVYPSQYEGWGLPVAESLAYGLPCVSANVSSMTEIASEKLISFVSPFDSSELLRAIKELSGQARNTKQADLIRREYQPYLWSKTAEQISKLF